MTKQQGSAIVSTESESVMTDNCEHKYVQMGDPQRRDEPQETTYTYRFFCEKCLDTRTKIRHVSRGDEYWTERKERQ